MMHIPFFLAFGLLPGCEYVDVFGWFSTAEVQNNDEALAINTPVNTEGVADEIEDDEEEIYEYNPSGKRDPFRTFLSQGVDPIPTDSFRRGPLQKYDVGQYEIQGIIWGVDRARALVKDPEGEGHVMELGTYVGKNWGKVTSIDECVVVVTEEYQTRDGELMITPITLRLRPEDQCKEL
jgi:type IV pilus assembly protein PilP